MTKLNFSLKKKRRNLITWIVIRWSFLNICLFWVCEWNQKSKIATTTWDFSETTHLIETTMHMNNMIQAWMSIYFYFVSNSISCSIFTLCCSHFSHSQNAIWTGNMFVFCNSCVYLKVNTFNNFILVMISSAWFCFL